MILTVTLNPSVDIGYKMDALNLDTVNRVTDVLKTAGGKGINVARVLKQLGEETAATGFIGGSLGEFIREQIGDLAIQDHFVGIAEDTRNCIAIIHDGKQTELLEGGPEITQEEAKSFLERFKTSIEAVDFVTISGSQPQGLPPDYYVSLLEIASQNETPVLLDTSGESLELALKSNVRPFFIKPNEEELAGLLKKELLNEAQIIAALDDPLLVGIPWVVVTLGVEGALIKHENSVYRVQIPQVEAVNPVGSGDSVVAGFAAGLSRGLTGDSLVKFGLAMGVLNAMEEKTGFIDPEKIEWCIEEIQVKKL